MKQKNCILFWAFLMLMFLPLNIYATNVDLSLSCTSSVKKEGVVTCTLKANITEGNLARISGSINATDTYLSPASQNFDVNDGWEEGSNQTIKNFHNSSKI